jgi:hypothetical protein
LIPTVLLVSLAWVPVLTQPDSSASEGVVVRSVVSPASGTSPAFRLERERVADGAELITLFGRLQDPVSGGERLDVAVLSVLRDNLGNSDTPRLRQVWILTSTRPTPWQRLASAFSFLCFRAGGKHHANSVPAPVLDLASPARSVVPTLVGKAVQSTQFDPLGILVRTSTRSYAGNSSDYRKLHLYQALGALESLEHSERESELLPDAQLREIYSRLRLTDHSLGGLVQEQKLSPYYDKESSIRHQTLGHNWELLRQRAEQAGLYFQPLALPDSPATLALLWVAREDITHSRDRRFDSQFLNIANPWSDDRLLHWSGYTEVRSVGSDSGNDSRSPLGAQAVEMIPLALYSLDHPRVPLLLADFRNGLKPKRNELVSHGATSLVTGVFGLTRFGSWPFFVGDSTVTFVRARHGAATDRSARLEAYSEARQFLAVDTTLDPRLKTELLRRLDHLAINPLENGISTEATVAKEQYAALLRYTESPKLAARLERDRQKELDAYTKSGAHRFFAAIGRLFTAPSPVDPKKPDSSMHADLAQYRRAASQMRFLDRVLRSSPRPEVAWNAEAIRNSVEALSVDVPDNPRAARLIARVFASSQDPDLRFSCLRALQRLDSEEAHNELWRLSQNPATTDSWRALCLLYFKGNTPAVGAAALGGGE